MPARHPRVRQGALGLVVAVAASAAVAIVAASPAEARQSVGSVGQTLVAAGRPLGLENRAHDPVQLAMDDMVATDRYPGALASVTGRDGAVHNYTSGVADLRTGARMPADGQVRIASNTKSFTAVVVLQLVAEGKIALDAPVETYLPNLLRGDGIDGRTITVRQVLQQNSGLPEYADVVVGDFESFRHRYTDPRTLLDVALAKKASFAPGQRWEYSNTNYIVAGLLIEKVSGRPVAEQITDRIINRIGLRHTYFPAVGEQGIRERHPQGYQVFRYGEAPVDVTELDPSWGWAAGQMISTPSELNRFFTALVSGRLLPAAQLAEMRGNTLDAASHLWPGARYGLGLIGTPLSCGGTAWGHGGDIPGFQTRDAVTDDGRAVTLAINEEPQAADASSGQEMLGRELRFIDQALCQR